MIDDDVFKIIWVVGYFRVGDIKGLLVVLENSFVISFYEGVDKMIYLYIILGL